MSKDKLKSLEPKLEEFARELIEEFGASASDYLHHIAFHLVEDQAALSDKFPGLTLADISAEGAEHLNKWYVLFLRLDALTVLDFPCDPVRLATLCVRPLC